VPLYEALSNASSVIARTIVNENDLIGGGKSGECRERIGNERLKVVGLVVAREEERELL
jgi:hypothetical protein